MNQQMNFAKVVALAILGLILITTACKTCQCPAYTRYEPTPVNQVDQVLPEPDSSFDAGIS